MSQKFNPQLFEFFQSQNQVPSQYPSSIFNPHLSQNPYYPGNQYEDFKKPFVNNFQDPSQLSNYFNSMENPQHKDSTNKQNNLNTSHHSNFQMQPASNCSSRNSTCSSDGINSHDTAKDTGLRSIISESCNLVNELN